MAACSVRSVRVQQQEDRWCEEMVFNIVLDLTCDLPGDILCRCLFTEDPWDFSKDRELEAVEVGEGPGLKQGVFGFDFPVAAPTKEMIEAAGVHDVTVVCISLHYKDQEFHRASYLVRHEYDSAEMQENPPTDVNWEHLQRVLSAPRIVIYTIDWGLPGMTGLAAEEPVPLESDKAQLIQRDSQAHVEGEAKRRCLQDSDGNWKARCQDSGRSEENAK
mmetsp:Transcript_2292/g.4781  ORF Transcript_2292/g.4781 Transcript_2292/m.4781 type:complete len:218 (+) Transcript_2292:94-747(+)|eukprot:CAMPEP_0178459194 /NCGR_PEP_ID=MMETSP0689_2-20121128/47981_1 /TAXON_ID=160604 /ORGANISM="Amphidinium massartii, Strain CS-259" /LENGTH=217 /DNA_ID=CAMNT_0020085617 /DNA_START=94 /DNA_END=747 /DNA_ORIENTATION=-